VLYYYTYTILLQPPVIPLVFNRVSLAVIPVAFYTLAFTVIPVIVPVGIPVIISVVFFHDNFLVFLRGNSRGFFTWIFTW